MDPNALLEGMRELTSTNLFEIGGAWEVAGHVQAMADQWAALDEWLSNGGFLPDDWKR
jgi:hypothetical protein